MIPVYNGLNYADWSEQVLFHLGALDLDLALLEEKPIVVNVTPLVNNVPVTDPPPQGDQSETGNETGNVTNTTGINVTGVNAPVYSYTLQ